MNFIPWVRNRNTWEMNMVSILLLMMSNGCANFGSAAFASPPNIVLIVIDDIGFGDLGCYGSQVHKTPNIDSLAAEGMRFTDFHTNGCVCSPTRAALLTGQYQQRSGVESAIGFGKDEGVPLEKTTIAELLGLANYTNGVFGKWHVGHVGRFGPNRHGFHTSYVSNNSPDYHTHISRVGELDWFFNHEPFEEEGYLTDLVTDHTIRFIEDNHRQPFFAFVSHIACHFPFQGPDDPPHRRAGGIWHTTKYGPLKKSEFRRAYRDMIEAVDRSVGQTIATLDRLGLRENTLVFVTSDNGAYSWVGDNGPYRGQKGDLFEGGHRVPAIANWPGKIASGVTHDNTIMSMDILPTLLTLAEIKTPDDLQFDGADLSRLLLEEEPLPQRQLFWRFHNVYTETKAIASRDGRWKYVEQDGERYLFNLRNDPSESKNLAAAHPDRLHEFQRDCAAWEKYVTLTAAADEPR